MKLNDYVGKIFLFNKKTVDHNICCRKFKDQLCDPIYLITDKNT